MLTKQELINMIDGEAVVFLGLIRDNQMLNLHMETDFNSLHYIRPYIGKTCRLIGQEEEGALECEFVACDMNGNIINNGMTVIEMVFEFASDSEFIDFDPVFERIPNYIQ